MLPLSWKSCVLAEGISSLNLMKRALADHRPSVATLQEGRP